MLLLFSEMYFLYRKKGSIYLLIWRDFLEISGYYVYGRLSIYILFCVFVLVLVFNSFFMIKMWFFFIVWSKVVFLFYDNINELWFNFMSIKVFWIRCFFVFKYNILIYVVLKCFVG